MTQELKIERLKNLLDRVQMRATQARRRPVLAEASATQESPQPDAVEVTRPVLQTPPVVMALTADSAETDETRPFAKLTAAELGLGREKPASPIPPPAEEATALHRTTDRPPPLAEIELETAELEAVEPEAVEPEAVELEVVEAEVEPVPTPQPQAEPPPASSRRPAQLREPEEISLEADMPLEQHDTEPPQSGPQLLEKLGTPDAIGSEFEVDFNAAHLDRAVVEAPARPSIAQLGQMVELEELPESAQAGIELAPPVIIETEPSTLNEMEASLPKAQSPGAYSAELASTMRPSEPKAPPADMFGPEPGSSIDWDVPEREASGVVDASAVTPVVEETPVVEVEEKPIIGEIPADAAAFAAEPTMEAVVAVEPTMEAAVEPTMEAAAEPTMEAMAGAEPTMESEAASAKPVEGTAGTLRLMAESVAPIVLEVTPVVVAPKQVTSADVAVFMGAVKEFAPATFAEWIDASLELGSE